MTISKKSMENTPPELHDMRTKVNEYLKKKIKNKKLSVKFEEIVYNQSLKETPLNEIKLFKYQLFKNRYNNNLKCIVSNITEFENKIKKKEISFNDIFNKSPVEIFPEKWNEVNKRKIEEEKFIYETHLKPNCLEKCSKCKEQNVHVKSKQVRSADEPETHYYLCITCGNRWVH